MTLGKQHEPFDRERWAQSVRGRTIEVTAPTPDIFEPGREEPGLHPPDPVTCRGCGREVMLVSEDRRVTGHCPFCQAEFDTVTCW